MAELLLGALLPVLFKHLASSARLLANREKVSVLVKKWETNLRDISALLADAEDKARRGSDERVQPWLDDLRDLAYDIEDVVDEFVTQEAARGLSEEETAAAAAAASGGCSIGRKVRSLLPSCCADLGPKTFTFHRELRSRMEKIDGRLESILKRKMGLGLKSGSIDDDKSWRMTDSLPEDFVIGRQGDKKDVIDLLLKETDEHLSVIPIVGMGGLGKTTLAKYVFNDPSLAEAFPHTAWACVSDNFNMLELARSLLESFGDKVDSKEIGVLHKRLGEVLSDKKFLIVLDDYWNVDYMDWERLRNVYRLGMKGSKIIVTTRLVNVASMINPGRAYYHLHELSSGDCLSLLEYHALNGRTFHDRPDLKAIGEKIADKCAGLPLAAKALGGLLRSMEPKANVWQEILESEIWNLPKDKDNIFPALKLSYIHLPSILKRCFTFCAAFPQDYEFDPDFLVLLWIAEGLVDVDRPNQSMLGYGRKLFDELLKRSFFQRSTQNESLFVMHDLMHDLATAVGGTPYMKRGTEWYVGPSPERIRHLHIINTQDLSLRVERFYKFKGVRTFLVVQGTYDYCWVGNEWVGDLAQNLICLRAISLSQYNIAGIPNCIGRHKKLRFLDFSGNRMTELPESICTLYNLETLILKKCRELTELPQGMNKLINLICLDIRDTGSLKKMPLGLGSLHKLEILSKFIVGREDGLRLKELQHLQNLHGELAISNLQNVEEVGDAQAAKLNTKENLTTLALMWDVGTGNSSSPNADNELQVLGFLQPHPNIEEVKVHGYGGISFPTWIGNNLFVNIKHMMFGECENITTLPSLGLLPSLRELEINGMNGVCTVGSEFFGSATEPFPSLEVLTFRDMRAWEAWSFSSGDKQIEKPFTRLSKLVLQGCPKLAGGWRHRLHSHGVQLEVEDCSLLQASPSNIAVVWGMKKTVGERIRDLRFAFLFISSFTFLGIIWMLLRTDLIF